MIGFALGLTATVVDGENLLMPHHRVGLIRGQILDTDAPSVALRAMVTRRVAGRRAFRELARDRAVVCVHADAVSVRATARSIPPPVVGDLRRVRGAVP